jgi:hypothetical protein
MCSLLFILDFVGIPDFGQKLNVMESRKYLIRYYRSRNEMKKLV